MRKLAGFCVAVLLAVLLVGCGVSKQPDTELQPPATQPAAEWRAVWVSYIEVAALLGGGEAASREAISGVMTRCREIGLTDIIWHVRANSDAYYASSVYPAAAAAASLLEAGFDPLACAVEAAHANGLRLHAWVNPYRVGDAANAVCAETFSYQERVYYDPSAPAVQRAVLAGIRELVQGYAIDGVQFDDYFYPVGSVPVDAAADFEQTYIAYVNAGGTLAVGDWRRQQVSTLVAAAYSLCHERDGCVFGVSPSHQAEATRDGMYADVLLWMSRTGYLDYICPQMYVGFENQTAPFETVRAKWEGYARADTVSLYAGLALYKAGLHEDGYAGSGASEWAAGGDIIAREMTSVRGSNAFSGVAFYSWRYFEPPDDGSRMAAVAAQEAANVLAALA